VQTSVTNWVTIRVWWWTESRRADVVRVHAMVIPAIKHALDDAGIDLPYVIQVHLLHDHTESTDGADRSVKGGQQQRKDRRSLAGKFN
jgi:hypothetical protein